MSRGQDGRSIKFTYCSQSFFYNVFIDGSIPEFFGIFQFSIFNQRSRGLNQKKVIDRKYLKRSVSGKYAHDSHLKLADFHSRMCLTTCALRLTITTFKRLKTPFPGLAERKRMPMNLPTDLFPHHQRHLQNLEKESNRL